MDKTTVEYEQQIFAVSDFREVMKDWHWSTQHEEASGKYSADNEHHTMELFYRILGNDVLLMYEKTRCFVEHRTRIRPADATKFYLLKFILNDNRPIQLIEGDKHYELHQGMVAFCNNCGTHTGVLPAEYRGETLQIIISHAFIREYINPRNLKAEKLHNIIYGEEGGFFTMRYTPAPVKRRLNALTKDLQHPPSVPMDKLHLLQKLGTLLETFFQMHLADGTAPASNHEGFKEHPAHKVAHYLEGMLGAPFPGMKFLATSFGISVSGLKRQFRQEFDTTPFRYYRHRQMQRARRWLQESSRSVAEVAHQSGFKSSSNFIRAFKAEFDTTPGQVKRQAQREEDE